MRQSLSCLRYGFLASLFLLPSLCGIAQGYRSKDIVYNSAQNPQIFNNTVMDSPYLSQVNYDSYGLYVGFNTSSGPYVALNDGLSWEVLLSPDRLPQQGGFRAFDTLQSVGAGKVLVTQASFFDYYVHSTYLVDRNSVAPIFTQPNSPTYSEIIDGNINHTMSDNRVSFFSQNLNGPNSYSIFDLRDNQLQVVSQTSLHDPVTGNLIPYPRNVQPYSDGILFSSSEYQPSIGHNKDILYTLHDGNVSRLLDLSQISSSYGLGTFNYSYPLQASSGNFLFCSYNYDTFKDQYTFIGHNGDVFHSFSRGETFPGLPGTIVSLSAQLDGDNTVLLLMTREANGGSTDYHYAVVRWHNGNYEMVENIPYVQGSYYELQRYYQGQIFLSNDYLSGRFPNDYQRQVIRYTLAAPVPEPSAYLIYGLAGLGIYLRRRSRRLESSRVTGIR